MEKGEADRGKVSDIKDGLSGAKGQGEWRQGNGGMRVEPKDRVIAKMKWKGDGEDIG